MNRRIRKIGPALLVVPVVAATSLYFANHSVAEDATDEKEESTFLVPGSFSRLAEEMSPAVVNVKVTAVKPVTSFGQGMPDEQFGGLLERFFGEMPRRPEGQRRQGAGSGVIISDDGVILTNNHVVEHAAEVTVTLSDQREYDAEVVGRDPKTDLAVLKIHAEEPLPTAAMGDSEALDVGDWVVAIGNPFGLNHTVTTGIVSAKGRVIGAGPYDDFIQTDASINPGNSGGPLFNMAGEVVGINTAIIPYGQGIGFAIPVNTAKPLIPQLVEDGLVTRGYIGVNIQTLTPDLARALDIDEAEGALVADVVSGGPADEGGIQRGDIIVTFDGTSVADSHDLPALVAITPVDEEVTVVVNRHGKERKLSLTVAKLAGGDEGLRAAAKPAGSWGLHLRDLEPETAEQLRLDTEDGVVVVGVEPGSPAEEAGIRQGDVIAEVDRRPVDSVRDVKKSIAKSKDKERLLLLVQRQDATFFVPLHQG